MLTIVMASVSARSWLLPCSARVEWRRVVIQPMSASSWSASSRVRVRDPGERCKLDHAVLGPERHDTNEASQVVLDVEPVKARRGEDKKSAAGSCGGSGPTRAHRARRKPEVKPQSWITQAHPADPAVPRARAAPDCSRMRCSPLRRPPAMQSAGERLRARGHAPGSLDAVRLA